MLVTWSARFNFGHRAACTCFLALVLLCATFAAGPAQNRPRRMDFWDLQLGVAASAMPRSYADYACGTAGGPPSLSLTGWQEFRRCPPEPTGLREVYFRYDDELEYWARAL